MLVYSEDSTPRILAFAAGVFLYETLVDLICNCVAIAIDHS